MNNEFVKKETLKTLYVLGVPYGAEKIINNNNTITGYVDGKPQWQFPNISNINDFKLEEGKEWDLEMNEVEELKQALAELTILISMGGM